MEINKYLENVFYNAVWMAYCSPEEGISYIYCDEYEVVADKFQQWLKLQEDELDFVFIREERTDGVLFYDPTTHDSNFRCVWIEKPTEFLNYDYCGFAAYLPFVEEGRK